MIENCVLVLPARSFFLFSLDFFSQIFAYLPVFP